MKRMITNTLADQVYEKLEKDILTGEYKRGDIITEISLSESLGVSRTPVREALRRLEQDHIIESRGKGMMVLGISREDVRVIYEIRSMVEGLAAAACARSATEEQIDEMRETIELQEFYVQRKDSEKVKAMDSRFHEMLYRYSGSVVYYDTLMPLHTKVQKVRKRSVEDESRASASTAEHRRILEAIAAQDPEAAKTAADEHVKKAKKHIMDMDPSEE